MHGENDFYFTNFVANIWPEMELIAMNVPGDSSGFGVIITLHWPFIECMSQTRQDTLYNIVDCIL